ncbi:MAG: hypothetical protein ACK41O_23360 [Runella zeae]
MKPDKFDEAIRQKLEGIQPSFQDEDWAKFKAYQTIQAPPSFIHRFGRSMLYTAASVAAAVMVFANVYQYRQNQKLDKQVGQLKQQLSQKEQEPLRTTTRVDTVYITKYIPIQSSFSQPKAYDPSVPSLYQGTPSTNGLNPRNEARIAESFKNIGKIVQKSPEELINETENEEDVLPKENADLNQGKGSTASFLRKNNSLSPNTNIESSTTNKSKIQRKESLATNTSNPENGIASQVSPVEGITTNETSTSSNKLAIELLESIDGTQELSGLAPAEIKVKRYAYATLQSKSSTANASTTTSPPPSISLRDVRLRLGGGLSIGDKYTGYGFSSSLLLGKYWSLNAGIQWAQIKGPQYFTDDIFKDKTGRPFQTWHKSPGIKPPLMQPKVFDIKTEVNLVRLPISLTYRWPIKDDFALLFSGGTHLNLNAKQCYEFYYKDRDEQYKEEKGSFAIQPALSNDVILSAGIEKQWRKLVFQVEAYTAPYLQKPQYLTDNRNMGVRLKVLYQFGKKPI